MKILNSQAEDSVNFINSKINAENIQIINSYSDALDSDFSKLNINNIYCENIKNDCLDFSFSEGEIRKVISKNVLDKVISTGESSNLKIGYLDIKDANLGVVSKDSSKLFINKLVHKNVKNILAAFIKKTEFKDPYIQINKINKINKDSFLISKGSKVIINNKIYFGEKDSKEIKKLIYK